MHIKFVLLAAFGVVLIYLNTQTLSSTGAATKFEQSFTRIKRWYLSVLPFFPSITVCISLSDNFIDGFVLR